MQIGSARYYDKFEYELKYSALFPRSKFPKGYDVYFVRYDDQFKGNEFGGYFANTALEKAYSVGSCDKMPVMIYVVNNTYSKAVAAVTYEQLELETQSKVQYFDLLYYVAWAVEQ